MVDEKTGKRVAIVTQDLGMVAPLAAVLTLVLRPGAFRRSLARLNGAPLCYLRTDLPNGEG